MSGLEVNKILAAIIMAVLILTLIGHLGDLIVNIDHGKHGDHGENGEGVKAVVTKEEIIEPISSLLFNASLEKGEKLFKKCGTCHSYKKDGVNKVGPKLWNIINRPKASIEGFAYSKALAEIGGEWTYEEIAEFLYKPKKYAKGTKMNFIGLKKVEDRANLVIFLREQSDNPIPLP
jgi:cytochrome c